jgi:hypothetical protein
MKKNLALLHIREDLLQTDQPASSQKLARPGRRRPESTEVNQSIGAQVAQLKECLVNDLKIDTIELDNWYAQQETVPIKTMLNLLTHAKRYGLNPILGEIACDYSDELGCQVYIPIDGWVTLILREPNFQGMTFTQAEKEEQEVPIWIECTIYRSDRVVPMTVREYLSEVKTNHPAWQKIPRRMLRYKALQQCARLSFGISTPELNESKHCNHQALDRDSITKQKVKSNNHSPQSSKELLKAKINQNKI